jgi:NAD(P)-dependent dehydrogenase (short-subunit alcohol dehydrogenase family)
MSDKWTIEDMPSLDGKRVVVTGSNSGIGYDTARICAQKGAHVILACRDKQSAAEAVIDIKQETPAAEVQVVELDLASLDSIKACADELLDQFDVIDVLVNNAGIMMTPYGTTEDGFEQQMGINHLGHFALTGRLLPAIKAGSEARVVHVSSLAHGWGTMDYDNLMFEGGRGYSASEAYGRSKLANLLFMRALEARFEEHGISAISVAAHPGMASTNLGRHLAKRWYLKLLMPLEPLITQPSEKGALPTLRALAGSDVEGGDYYGPDGFKQYRGNPVKVGSSKASRDMESAEQLWEFSEDATGVTYDW